ncbi:MAG: 50S ribosomal protein L14 [Candidatus Bipolaricaulota bacterium]
MILARTMLTIADNTGVKEVRCITVQGKRPRGQIGDIVVGSVRKRIATSEFTKGDVVRGVVVRSHAPYRRSDGSTIRFDENALVLVDKNLQPIGTRVFGPVARELRDKGMMRIISLAPEVV